jgi:hypothetical protein
MPRPAPVPRLYPRIPHLPGSRTGPGDHHVGRALADRCTVGAPAGDVIVVQEKLDGTCVAVVRGGDDLTAFGREGRPCAESRNEGRRAFDRWVRENLPRFAFLAKGERLVCEWLAVAHGTRYALPHEPVVLLDHFDAVGERAPLGRLREIAALAALPLPHLVHAGGAMAVAEALALLGAHGRHGAVDPAEGLVYRVESAGRVVALAKYVRSGKVDGCYLADHTGGEDVPNTWQAPPRSP